MTTQWTLTTDTGDGGRIHGPVQGLEGGKRSANWAEAVPGKTQAIRQWKPGLDVPLAQWARIVQGGHWTGWVQVQPEAIRW